MGGLFVKEVFVDASWSRFNGEEVNFVASWFKEEGLSTVTARIVNVYKTTDRK